MAKSNDGSSIAWFLAGMTVGAAVAVLFAPKSGQETRQSISEAASRGKDLADRKTREVVEFGRDAYTQGRDLADSAKETGKEVIDRGKKALADLSPNAEASAAPEASPSADS